MRVQRIHEENSSYIEPPLSQHWPDAVALEWHAAVVSCDTGLEVRVHQLERRSYNVEIRGVSSMAPFGFDAAWDFLVGIEVGWRARGKQLEET